jgi:uncharacterized protein (DUF4415 family)
MSADLSHIKGWKPARKVVDPARFKPPARRITINLDADIIATFKAEAFRGGLPYQVAINQALREYLLQREKDAEAEAVEAVLSALDDPAVRRKIRRLSRAP